MEMIRQTVREVRPLFISVRRLAPIRHKALRTFLFNGKPGRSIAFLGFDGTAPVVRELPEDRLVAGGDDSHKFAEHTQHIGTDSGRRDEDG